VWFDVSERNNTKDIQICYIIRVVLLNNAVPKKDCSILRELRL